MAKEIKHIAVVGEGKMGSSIFFYLNDFDYQLSWLCSSETEEEKAQKSFNKKTRLLFQSGIFNETEYNSKTETTRITCSLKDIADCDLVIEAITEDMDLKKALFKSLDELVKPDCIFTSNSSSINPSLLIPSKQRRDKFAGLHFFYPVSFKNIVELISVATTSFQTLNLLKQFLWKIKKQPFLEDEANAFILNRLFLDFQAGAYQIFTEGKLSFEEIDDLVRQYLFPIGVFEFFDHVGIDIMLSSVKTYTKVADNKDFYAPLIQKMEELVSMNRLGIKTKQGFYDYSHTVEKSNIPQYTGNDIEEYKRSTIDRLWGYYIKAVSKVIESKLCSREELAYIVKDYMGMDKDPFMKDTQ